MSDATIDINESDKPVPTGTPNRTRRFCSKDIVLNNGPSSTTSMITRSRARARNGTEPSIIVASDSSAMMEPQIVHHVFVKPAPIPDQRNVATMCKVATATKGTSYTPTVANKGIQTDEVQEKIRMVPVPVPIFVPCPMWMYSMPFPVPFPFPLPVPVPIFIPTTQNSATSIMEEMKKILDKTPSHPFEADLIMMAEMVARDNNEENSDPENKEEDTIAVADEGTFSLEPVNASNTFGYGMLKMATELDEPAVDLDSALTANTITFSQGGENTGSGEATDGPQPMHTMMERQTVRGRKRPSRRPKNAASKRGRRSSSQMENTMMGPPQPPAPPKPVESPDANMCLKFQFGVNAWKQWVTTKNAELKKSSCQTKLFKPEILQMTADELNYSLCLFVKEIKKSNGQEYLPDTIYYLCLGIQHYLFENGRIDNIFYDTYYEKFTDCLDEVAKKFSVMYNDSNHIVTRVDEEHLWESNQLGAHSPYVLLSTLMYFNTKHFNLMTIDEHMQLSFAHVMKDCKPNPNQPRSKSTSLRFYPPQSADSIEWKKKIYEQQGNKENPLRCPVKLYDFYLSKCPESVKTRNDVFYLIPERACIPDSPVWYSTMPLPRTNIEKMLHRVKMIKEINVALLINS